MLFQFLEVSSFFIFLLPFLTLGPFFTESFGKNKNNQIIIVPEACQTLKVVGAFGLIILFPLLKLFSPNFS